MEDLLVLNQEEDQQTCPVVICDRKAGTCRIEGLSFMENSRKFYKPIIDWISEFIESGTLPFHLHLKVSYLNSSSAKIFFDLFAKLKDYKSQGKVVTAEWHYAYFDDEIEEDIDDMIYESEFDIKKVPYNK